MSSRRSERAAVAAALHDELAQTGAMSVLFGQAVADRVGMNPTDLEALDILRRNGPLTAGRLAALTGLTTGAITGLVDRLERLGYARRDPDPSDRRRVIVRVRMENAGRDLWPAYAPLATAMTELFARYGDAELAAVLDFIRRSNAIVAEQIARTRAKTESIRRPARAVAGGDRGAVDDKDGRGAPTGEPSDLPWT